MEQDAIQAEEKHDAQLGQQLGLAGDGVESELGIEPDDAKPGHPQRREREAGDAG